MQFTLSTIVFSFLLFFLWDIRLPMLTSVRESWVWNKEGGFGTTAPLDLESPEKTINGYLIDNRYYAFATGKFLDILEPKKIDFSLLLPGYIEYEKIGDEVNFFSGNGELYWKKPINSYPRSGYYGTPVLYLSGDNNTVFLMDTSGNSLGAGEINGRFLTDFDFDQSGNGAIILFSGGEIYRVDDKGKILFQKDLSLGLPSSFFKSVSVSPNGNYSVVHYSQGQKDYISILDANGEEDEKWELEGFYPHKIYLAIGNSKNTLFNLPEKVVYYESDRMKWVKLKQKVGSIYQAVYAMPAGFIYDSEMNINILNEFGGSIRTKIISSGEHPIRFFPGKSKNTFYMETRKDIYMFNLLE